MQCHKVSHPWPVYAIRKTFYFIRTLISLLLVIKLFNVFFFQRKSLLLVIIAYDFHFLRRSIGAHRQQHKNIWSRKQYSGPRNSVTYKRKRIVEKQSNFRFRISAFPGKIIAGHTLNRLFEITLSIKNASFCRYTNHTKPAIAIGEMKMEFYLLSFVR